MIPKAIHEIDRKGVVETDGVAREPIVETINQQNTDRDAAFVPKAVNVSAGDGQVHLM
ncbi:hypothetical protein [Neorhodopirellula pilleata]|uniref:hypothetical protein n=1 Tax=Neorhodopirellula pilleata TaxID=2714738 RepID=UPI0018CE8E93|nr:hypothetical protein [Neorhodopirellula pilleata]